MSFYYQILEKTNFNKVHRLNEFIEYLEIYIMNLNSDQIDFTTYTTRICIPIEDSNYLHLIKHNLTTILTNMKMNNLYIDVSDDQTPIVIFPLYKYLIENDNELNDADVLFSSFLRKHYKNINSLYELDLKNLIITISNCASDGHNFCIVEDFKSNPIYFFERLINDQRVADFRITIKKETTYVLHVTWS